MYDLTLGFYSNTQLWTHEGKCQFIYSVVFYLKQEEKVELFQLLIYY